MFKRHPKKGALPLILPKYKWAKANVNITSCSQNQINHFQGKLKLTVYIVEFAIKS